MCTVCGAQICYMKPRHAPMEVDTVTCNGRPHTYNALPWISWVNLTYSNMQVHRVIEEYVTNGLRPSNVVPMLDMEVHTHTHAHTS